MFSLPEPGAWILLASSVGLWLLRRILQIGEW